MSTNKGERERKTKIIFKRRLKRMRILDKSGQPKEEQYCYKNQGKPCSCPSCNHEKYKRKTKHKRKYDQEEESSIK